jgi:hypothetical protein
MSPIPPNILETFRRNLDALLEMDENTAKKIADFDWSKDIVFKTALDGTPSAFGAGLSRSGWFAASGAPAIREKVFSDKTPVDQVNLILPGGGHGYGLKQLLSRMRPWQTIFVHEPNLKFIAILLGLNDFSSAIKNRQLILLTASDLKDGLIEFFGSHSEFIVPTKMMSWPWLSEQETAALSQKVEQAINEINPQIVQKTALSRQKLLEAYQTSGTTETIAIISLIDKRGCDQLADNIRWAAEKQKLTAETYLLDRPEHNGLISLANQLRDLRPRLIASIGLARRQINLQLPPSVRFLSFLGSPGEEFSEQEIAAMPDIDSNERWVVGNQRYYEIMQSRIDEAHLSLIDLAVSPEAMTGSSNETEFRIGLFADKPEADPEALGIRQKSQQALWQMTGQIIGENPLAFSFSETADWISRASDRSGVKLSDPELIRSFSYLVEHCLAKAVVAGAMAKALKQAEISFHIYGSGWDSDADFSASAELLPYDNRSLKKAFDRCDFVLCLDHPEIIPDALCCGRPAIVLTPPSNLSEYPDVLQGLLSLDPKKPFIQQIKSILQNKPAHFERVLKVRNYLCDHFSYEKLLASLLQ